MKTNRLNFADRIIVYTIAVVLLCVAVRAVLDVAATVIVPVLIVGFAYLAFRLWQAGVFSKLSKKPQESPRPKEETNA